MSTKWVPRSRSEVLSFRIGIGHDTHRLADGGKLRIGGVDIDFDRHMVGHSDADVLLHAVTDALLGAIAAGDIGELFPDTADENKGRDSADFLMAAMQAVSQQGYRVQNLDCIVFAQKPKLSPYKRPIEEKLAELLQLELSQVNVKAKTGESVGPIGRQEAISAECVVLLAKAI
ncbi:MAG: 2-C-methyl-D-erythritol 2,4-cyclodiphosphate synthase [Planctomycetales bacterium]|nr:2-C-methyl-D-erythritol 2,4-cyclodiphosphate synthase [Planctomycetales bacterium]